MYERDGNAIRDQGFGRESGERKQGLLCARVQECFLVEIVPTAKVFNDLRGNFQSPLLLVFFVRLPLKFIVKPVKASL